MGLATTYQQLRHKSRKSNYRIANLSGLDPAFLGRIAADTRGASRDTVIRIGFALIYNSDLISLYDVDCLLLAADFAPLQRDR